MEKNVDSHDGCDLEKAILSGYSLTRDMIECNTAASLSCSQLSV